MVERLDKTILMNEVRLRLARAWEHAILVTHVPLSASDIGVFGRVKETMIEKFSDEVLKFLDEAESKIWVNVDEQVRDEIKSDIKDYVEEIVRGADAVQKASVIINASLAEVKKMAGVEK